LEDSLKLAKALWSSDETAFAGQHFSAPAITNNPRPLSRPHPRILIGGTGPNKTLRMVAQYADACNIGEWVGTAGMQKSLDILKAHCESLGRDYDTIEKTSLCTVNLSGGDTAEGVIRRIQELSKIGFTHAIFNMPDVYEIRPLNIFAKDIIPAVAGL
jgi:alkanesulfonate monooxygenase SsuD/methylene tetrahydromethanopterin reductase-like flavin-dependent oxidoreductase (luciferase family)